MFYIKCQLSVVLTFHFGNILFCTFLYFSIYFYNFFYLIITICIFQVLSFLKPYNAHQVGNMIIKRNTYKSKKEKNSDLQKRLSYIHLKYNLDQTLQEINKIKSKKKKP